MKEVAEAIRKAEAKEGEEVRVRLMETNRDELIDLADKVERQAADETEPSPLIELGEEIEYRWDNVVSIARLLKGNVHEEFKERAQRALDESVEAARVGKQRLDAFQARLEFHSFHSEAGSYGGRSPARGREAAPGGHPPNDNPGRQAGDTSFRAGPVGVNDTTCGQTGSADLATLLRGWGQLKANDSGWPVFNSKYVNYPRFKKEWVAYVQGDISLCHE
jgi:hypothetical protein